MRRLFSFLACFVLIAWTIPSSRAQAPASHPVEFDQEFLQAMERFANERDYAASTTEFAMLLSKAPTGQLRLAVFGYLNASLYALGRHEEALDHICTEIKRSIRPAHQWIFDIHAHARKIALNEGYERAVDMILSYRRKCQAGAFSPFWVAISLVKMEYLKQGVHVLAESYALPEKDRIVLKQLLARFPNDPYREYALYFLHDFQAVQRPELIALRKGTPADPIKDDIQTGVLPNQNWLTDRYVQFRMRAAPEEDRQHLSAVLQKRRCETAVQCRSLAKWIPDSVIARNLIVEAAQASLTYPLQDSAREAEMEDYSRIFFDYTRNTKSADLRRASKELEYFLNRLREVPSDVRRLYLQIYTNRVCGDVNSSTDTCISFLRHFSESNRSRTIVEDTLRSLDDFKQLRAFYRAIPPTVLAVEERRRRGTLGEYENHVDTAISLLERGMLEDLLKYAIKIRGRITKAETSEPHPPRYPYLAAKIFAFIAMSEAGKLLGEKAHWLRIGVGGRISIDSGADLTLKQFIERYPNSRLIDDAYAELGLSYLGGEDKKLGRQLLEKVWREYPKMNAADNALAHLAQDAIKEGRYLAAAGYYTRILTYVASGRRLREQARSEIPIIRSASEALRQRKSLQGVALSPYGQVMLLDRSKIASDGSIEGSDLKTLDGREATLDTELYAALEKRSIGDWVDVVFEQSLGWDDAQKRQKTKQIKMKLRVENTAVFDVRFVGWNDKLKVRERPDPRSTEVDEVAPDARCLRFAGEESSSGKGSDLWVKVRYLRSERGEMIGWVNGRYLRRSVACLN